MTPPKIKPPLTTTTSILPAAFVLGLAVVMLAVFMVINLVANQGVATTTTIPVVVGGLSVDHSSSLLNNCAPTGSLPANIVGGIVVPVNTSSRGPFQLPNSGAGDFDCYRPLVSSTSASALLGFYKAQLEARGWALFSSGATNGAPQYLFQKAGSDTFYWIIGVTVNPTTSSATSTDWTFRIYQNSSAI
ncbi:MAG: hypothetical protein HKL85_11280 [Acidimicrobiaceae bacterium]|nr:hypothetical protein [Acidimicrobiaceae bacterium]